MPPQRPTEKERGVVEDVEIPRLPSACDIRAWLRENRNGLDRGGRKEDRKGECVLYFLYIF